MSTGKEHQKDFFTRTLGDIRQQFMSHVRAEIQARVLPEQPPIGLDEYKVMRLNSYERAVVHRKLTFEALTWLLEECLKNCQYRECTELQIPRHYDEAVIGELVPMLLRRIKAGESLPKQEQ